MESVGTPCWGSLPLACGGAWGSGRRGPETCGDLVPSRCPPCRSGEQQPLRVCVAQRASSRRERLAGAGATQLFAEVPRTAGLTDASVKGPSPTWPQGQSQVASASPRVTPRVSVGVEGFPLHGRRPRQAPRGAVCPLLLDGACFLGSSRPFPGCPLWVQPLCPRVAGFLIPAARASLSPDVADVSHQVENSRPRAAARARVPQVTSAAQASAQQVGMDLVGGTCHFPVTE